MVNRTVGIWMLSILTFYKIETITGQTGAQAKDLRTKLFVTDRYDFRVRPINLQKNSVDVTVDFNLLAINSLNEVSETLKTTGYLEVVWTDEFLKWNTSDWGGIYVSYWPQNEVWKPDIALRNSYKDYKQLGVSSLNVEVNPNGRVKWTPFQAAIELASLMSDGRVFQSFGAACMKLLSPNFTKRLLGTTSDTDLLADRNSLRGLYTSSILTMYLGESLHMALYVFESTCSIDITYFPFDEQVCSLVFVAWSYTKRQVLVTGGSSGMVLEDYEGNSQWDVTRTWWSDFEDDHESSITFHLKVKRKPLYDILTMVFPVILLGLLNILVFALPCESGEKAGYSITVFLSFAVFLTIIESSFPRNSETVAYFAIYVITQTAQSTLITFLSLFMIKCSHFDDSIPIPKLVIVLAKLGKFRWDTFKCMVRKKNEVHQINEDDHAQKSIPPTDGTGVVATCNDLKTDDLASDETYTWNRAMNGLDNILLLIFTCILVSVTMGCMMVANNGN